MNKIRDLIHKIINKYKNTQGSETEEFFEDSQDQDAPPQFDKLPSDSSSEEQEEYDIEIDDPDTEKASALEKLKEKLSPLIIRSQKYLSILRGRLSNINLKELKVSKDTDSSATQNARKFSLKLKNITWENLPNEFFKKENRNLYHRYFLISAIFSSVILAAIFTGDILKTSLLAGKGSSSNAGVVVLDTAPKITRSDLDKLKKAEVFKTKKEDVADSDSKKPTKKVVISEKRCEQANKKSNIDVKLVNTIVLQDSVKSIASVQIRSEQQLQQIREGETLLGKAKVDRIERLKLIVKNLNTGECEAIENADFAKMNRPVDVKVMSKSQSKAYKQSLKKIKGIENKGNDFQIERSFLKDKLSDINSILTQARGIPMRNPDGSYSFKIVDVEPGGVFAYLGVQNGDIITQINGKAIKDINEVMNYFGKVTSLSSLNLTISRGGEEVTQNYKIK